jgi:outer membrane protein TolC
MRVETLEAEIKIRLARAREDEGIALSGLRGLVADPDADTEEGPLTAVDYPLAGVGGYVKDSSTLRPELRAAREGVAALDEQARLEKARWLPDFALFGGASVTGAQGVDDPPSALAWDPFNTARAEIALVMRWNVDPAAQIARVERTQAERARGAALLEAVGSQGEFAVRQAYQQARGAKERLEAARQGEKSARGWVASVMQADAIGTTSTRDMADAYLAYFMLKGRVLESTYDWNLAVFALKRAVGSLVSRRHP